MSRSNRILRFLDRSFGPWLLRFLSFFRLKKRFPENIKKIALMKFSGIGDLVLLSACLQDLKKAFPKAECVVFSGKDNQALLKLLPACDQVQVLDILKPFQLLQNLRKDKFDLFFDFGQWSCIEAFLTFISGAAFSIGFKTTTQRRHFLYDAIAGHRSDVHEIDNYRSLLKLARVKTGCFPSLRFSKKPSAFLSDEKSPFYVFHPWPSGLKAHLKEWPNACWIALAKELCSKGSRVLISGSRQDFPKTKRLIDEAKLEGLQSVAGKFDLEELGDLFLKSQALVTVNTGIMHMAATLDVPMIALHGPTSIKRWGPLSQHAICLCPKDGSGEYLNLGFEYPSIEDHCMKGISLDMVKDALKRLDSCKEKKY